MDVYQDHCSVRRRSANAVHDVYIADRKPAGSARTIPLSGKRVVPSAIRGRYVFSGITPDAAHRDGVDNASTDLPYPQVLIIPKIHVAAAIDRKVLGAADHGRRARTPIAAKATRTIASDGDN